MTWLNNRNGSEDTGREAVTPRGRATRRLAAALAAALSAVLLVANPAAAAKPQVIEEGTIDETFTVPAEDNPCGVEVTTRHVQTFKVTMFFDKDGNPDHATVHAHGMNVITSEHGQLWERFSVNGVLDPATGELTYSGNSFNMHGSDGGILANVSGRWVVDFQTGELISVLAGPHEDPSLDPDVEAALCAELTP